MSHTIQTFKTQKMCYGLTFPRAKQYKIIHEELTMKYLLFEQS